jgi:hypothetical protein
VIRALLLAIALTLLAPVIAHKALSHDWYTSTSDPKHGWRCCGFQDCAVLKVEPGMLTGEENGYRLRMTREQASRINPHVTGPVDALITWDRVQPSPDGNWHVCLMTSQPTTAGGGVFCFFQPGAI